MASIGDRIRKMRLERGLTQAQLAESSGTSINYVNRFENDEFKNPTLDTLEKFARALEVHPGELIESGTRSQDLEFELVEDFIEIPLLTGNVSAKDFTQSFENWTGETFAIPRGMFKGKGLVAWRIKIKSMEPAYINGDRLIISKEYDCKDGIDVVTSEKGKEVTVKKVKSFKDGTLELRPYDPDYPTLQVQDQEGILGKVVGFYRRKE